MKIDAVKIALSRLWVLGQPRVHTGEIRIQPRRFAQAPDGFFTIGSLKADVIAVQGEPEQTMHGLFRYGFSSVFFEIVQLL